MTNIARDCRQQLLEIFQAALVETNGRARVSEYLHKHPLASPVYLIAFGKPPAPWRAGAHEVLGNRIRDGHVVTKRGSSELCRPVLSGPPGCRMQPVSEAGERLIEFGQIVRGTRRYLTLPLRRRVGTGGGPAVRPGVDMAAGAESRCGCSARASIFTTMNAIRKRISLLKAGVSHSCFIPAKYCVWRFPMFPAMTHVPSVPGRWSRKPGSGAPAIGWCTGMVAHRVAAGAAFTAPERRLLSKRHVSDRRQARRRHAARPAETAGKLGYEVKSTRNLSKATPSKPAHGWARAVRIQTRCRAGVGRGDDGAIAVSSRTRRAQSEPGAVGGASAEGPQEPVAAFRRHRRQRRADRGRRRAGGWRNRCAR